MARQPKRREKAARPRAGRLARPYPQLPLERALEPALAIKEANGGNPLEPKLIAEYCKVSPKSSDLVYLLSASSRFGLTDGSKASSKISLTEVGRNLVYAASAEQEKELKK